MKKLLVFVLSLAVAASVFARGDQDAAATQLPSFTVLNGAEPPSLDPSLMTDTSSFRVHMALFEGLVQYDPKTQDPIPAMALSWSASEDMMTYTFKLRNARWSDGTPVTAQQFVDSWLRTLNPDTASAYAWMIGMVVKGANEYNSGDAGPEAVQIRALDARTFQVDLLGPAAYFVGMLAHQTFSVMPIHVIEEYGDSWTQPENMVTNGPFVLEAWRPQEVLTVVKSDSYWDADNVKLGRVIFIPSDNNNTRWNMHLNGESDWMRGGIPTDQIDVAKLRPDYHEFPGLGVYYYAVNQTEPPMDDVNVRKALAMSFDRTVVTDKILRSGQVPAYSVSPPMDPYYPPKGTPYDIEMAKEYLAKAGYPDGKGFPGVILAYNTSESHQRIAEFIQQEWETNLGIKVTLENQEWKTHLARGQNQDFTIMRIGWIGDYKDPNTMLDLFITDGGNNYGKYSNPRFDELIRKSATMPDGPDRLAVLQEAEKIFIEEDQGLIPIYYYSNNDLIDTEIWGGWYSNVLGNHPWKFIYRK